MTISARLCRTMAIMATLTGLAGFVSTALAESGNYRIEVLVFNHLESDAQPRELEEIRSFSSFPEHGEFLQPAAPMKLEVMSSTMQDAWRRLRLSATYRPLLFASWEQSRIDYHPPVRLHDEELIAKQVHFPYEVAFVDLQSVDMFEDYMAPYYRLDGTVQLQRTRFLHLNLDLEFRQDLLPRPLSEAGANGFSLAAPLEPESVDDDQAPVQGSRENIENALGLSPGPALVHGLKQTRQIRTGQMQYFDTPYLGVLVRVTATAGM